jgi:hypothetical protein
MSQALFRGIFQNERVHDMHKPVSVSLVLLALSAAVQPAAAQNLSPMAPPQTAYVTVAQVDVMKLVPPPPAPQSEEQQRDIEKLLAIQKTRTPQQEQRASPTRHPAHSALPMCSVRSSPRLRRLSWRC